MAKALFDAKRSDMFWFEPEKLKVITDKKDPMYDPRVELPVNEELVASIMLQGIIEPIVIYKNGDEAVVCDGRQRVKAAVEANKKLVSQGKIPVLVPCVNRKGGDSDLFAVMIASNEHRKEDSPIEKARKLSRFLSYGGTAAEAAIVFGVTTQTISNWLTLLDLDRGTKQKIESGEISATAATKAAKQPKDRQKKMWLIEPKKKKTMKLIRAEYEKTEDNRVKVVLAWVLGVSETIDFDNDFENEE